MKLLLTAASLFVGSLSAQQTIVVDWNGGGAFFDVQPALDAASPGDTIVVRPGIYSGADITKGVRLVFDPGLVALAPNDLYVRNVPAGESVVVSGVRPASFFTEIFVSNNAGRVHIEDSIAPMGMTVSTSAQVSLVDIEIAGVGMPYAGALGVGFSDVWITDCSIAGGFGVGPIAGIDSIGSNLFITDCDIAGADPGFSLTAGPAIRADGGSVTITGDITNVLIAGTASTQTSAVELSSNALLIQDPGVVLIPTGLAVPVAGGVPTLTSIPFLRGNYDGNQLTLDLHSTVDVFGIVFASLPAPVFPFGPAGWWLDANAFPLSSGGSFVGGVHTTTLTFPPFAPGIEFAFQGVVIDAAAAAGVSTPLVLTLD